MYQFKTSNNLKQTLKFGTPKGNNQKKLESTLNQSKASVETSFGSVFDSTKTPSTFWKKGTYSSFPARAQSNHVIPSSYKTNSMMETLPPNKPELGEKSISQNSNPNVQSLTTSFAKSQQISPIVDQFSTHSFGQPSSRSLLDEEVQIQIRNLKGKLNDSIKKRDQLEKKIEEFTSQSEKLKQINRQQRKKNTQSSNTINRLQAQLFIATSKLKEKQESLISIASKQSDMKRLIVTLSQQKNDLSNRISQLLEQKAAKDNENTFNKIQKTKTQNELQSTRIQQLQQINQLKSRVHQLQEKQSSNQKQYYQDRIRMLQKQVKQLLTKCMSNNESLKQRNQNYGNENRDSKLKI